jgi:polyhydroxyalkanoate synthase subunit PhaC
MPKDVEMVPGFTELIDLSKRVANAASQLARVRETDVEIDQTPREEIYRIAGRALYRIALDHPRRVQTPVLVSYAMVGHWNVLDLQDDRSFVRNLVEAGCDVYVMDWGHPAPADQFDDFGDLVKFLHGCFRRRDPRTTRYSVDQSIGNLPRWRVIAVLRGPSSG